MPKPGWKSISIKEELYKEIKENVDKDDPTKQDSVHEVVKKAWNLLKRRNREQETQTLC